MNPKNQPYEVTVCLETEQPRRCVTHSRIVFTMAQMGMHIRNTLSTLATSIPPSTIEITILDAEMAVQETMVSEKSRILYERYLSVPYYKDTQAKITVGLWEKTNG